MTEDKQIPIPGIDAINICDDKYLFIETIIENGFGDLIPEIGTDLPVPFMLKKEFRQPETVVILYQILNKKRNIRN